MVKVQTSDSMSKVLGKASAKSYFLSDRFIQGLERIMLNKFKPHSSRCQKSDCLLFSLFRTFKKIDEQVASGKASKKTFFFWEISPKYGWLGRLIPKQGPNPPKSTRKSSSITLCSPKSHKNPWVGGWVNRFGRDLPKKRFFLDAFPTLNSVLNSSTTRNF